MTGKKGDQDRAQTQDLCFIAEFQPHKLFIPIATLMSNHLMYSHRQLKMKDCQQDKLLEGHSTEIPQQDHTFYIIVELLNVHEASVFVWVASLTFS